MAHFNDTISIVGCGSLGTAILIGLLRASEKPDTKVKPSKFIATVTSENSVQRVQKALSEIKGKEKVEILISEHEKAAQASNVVILACPPGFFDKILQNETMQSALDGKILVSILAGVTTHSLVSAVNHRCSVFRALPNLAVTTGASATAIEIANDTDYGLSGAVSVH